MGYLSGQHATTVVDSPPIPMLQGRIVPAVDVDLYAGRVVEDSAAAFKQIRDAGPVVWLPRNRMWAMGRFQDVREALRDDELFASDHGVAANPITNLVGRKSILFSNGEAHARRRGVMKRPLGAKALAPAFDRIDSEADEIVKGLVGIGEFDAVRHFSSGLPIRVIAGLIGLRLPAEQLLHWGPPFFDQLGALNRRWLRSHRDTLGVLSYLLRLSRSRVIPGSWAAGVFEAVDRGEISGLEGRLMIADMVTPNLDTTIISNTHLLWLLGRNPEAWQRLRQEPELIPAAVVEAVRICSPVRCFTRRVSREAELGGVQLNAGDRVAVLFGAADMDERRFPDPTRFDLDRSPANHLGWGNGPHACIGLNLAKRVMQAMLRALTTHVETIDTVESPRRIHNNTLQGIAELPVRLS
jgi:cytochrome P450